MPSRNEAPEWLRNPSGRTLTTGIVLALLYLGRSVLIPLALAILLSLLVAPLVRTLRRLRVGRTFSVLVAVSAMGFACLGVAAAIGTQVLHIAASLPQYELNVQRKLKILEDVTTSPLLRLTDETSRLTRVGMPVERLPVQTRDVEHFVPAAMSAAALLPQTKLGSQPPGLMWTLLATLWHPLQFAGIVLLVLIFVLLDHRHCAIGSSALPARPTYVRRRCASMTPATGSRGFCLAVPGQPRLRRGHLDEP